MTEIQNLRVISFEATAIHHLLNLNMKLHHHIHQMGMCHGIYMQCLFEGSKGLTSRNMTGQQNARAQDAAEVTAMMELEHFSNINGYT